MCYPEKLLNNSNDLFVDSFGFPIYTSLSSSNDSLIFSFLILIFLFFSLSYFTGWDLHYNVEEK